MTETMAEPFRWTENRLSVLKNMWMKGRPLADIAALLGTPSKSAVSSKAQQIGLPLHPSASVGDQRERAAGSDRVVKIKLPQLTFLERRFDWEPRP